MAHKAKKTGLLVAPRNTVAILAAVRSGAGRHKTDRAPSRARDKQLSRKEGW